MIAFALLLQAAPQSAPVTRASAAPAARFSVLYDPCPTRTNGDVVVCGSGDSTTAQRLPLRDEAPPTPNYVKPDSGDFRDNRGGPAPCAARMGGCQVGFGPPLAQWIAAGARAIGDAAKTHREARARAADGARRQAIDLSAQAPAGRVEP